MDLSEDDLDILTKLSRDGRKTYNKLAEELKKSPVTIKKYVEELENKGIIEGYGVTINYEQLGFEIIALIELTISKGKMLEVERDIAKNPHVFGVYDITGEYDALIFARFKRRDELSQLVKDINSYEYVIRTNTHIVLNVIKEGSSFSELMKEEAAKNKEKKSS
ncbi:MAG: putative HTH-type transcriptional regulator [Promethearchaeota archaeon]|jgi:DNA-binding Lrp family transcriptional regulator|nr:MAG: putative HTH-type transcriptional regulator [Candidatus Lokiarchaeota archaeon]